MPVWIQKIYERIDTFLDEFRESFIAVRIETMHHTPPCELCTDVLLCKSL